jgi:hypothetical protein
MLNIKQKFKKKTLLIELCGFLYACLCIVSKTNKNTPNVKKTYYQLNHKMLVF